MRTSRIPVRDDAAGLAASTVASEKRYGSKRALARLVMRSAR